MCVRRRTNSRLSRTIDDELADRQSVSVDRAGPRPLVVTGHWVADIPPFDNFVDGGGYVSYNTYAIVGVGG